MSAANGRDCRLLSISENTRRDPLIELIRTHGSGLAPWSMLPVRLAKFRIGHIYMLVPTGDEKGFAHDPFSEWAGRSRVIDGVPGNCTEASPFEVASFPYTHLPGAYRKLRSANITR